MAPRTRILNRKSSNAENSGHDLAKPRVSSMSNVLRDASRRRRDRVYSKSTLAIKEAIQRHKIVSARALPTPPQSPAVQPVASTSATTITATTDPVIPPGTTQVRFRFPAFLQRPNGRAVPALNLEAVDAALLGIPASFIRDTLAEVGPRLWQVTQSVKSFSLAGLPSLPDTLQVTVTNFEEDSPSRLLAVYKYTLGPGGTRAYTLIPVHDAVLASHSLTLPPLLRGNKTRATSVEPKLMLPTTEVAVPHPESMKDIMRYLYTKDRTTFMAALLPFCPHAPPPSDDLGPGPINRYANNILQTFTSDAILRFIAYAHGIYLNMCQFGIVDNLMWQLLNAAWQTLMIAFAHATHQADVLRDAPY